MSIQFHTMDINPLFGDDYSAVRSFLIRLNGSNYHFGRWDWMVTHGYLDASGLDKIGIWQDGDTLVALATYDCQLGAAFLLTLPGYEHLRGDMLPYAQKALGKEGKCKIIAQDGDEAMHALLMQNGYLPSQDKEQEAVFTFDPGEFSYTLPEGFRITSMRETYDLYKYGQVLWKGFNHEANGEGAFQFSDRYQAVFERPNVNRDIKIAVVAPDGEFAAYCGMWQDDTCENALVEPVATIPKYRKMGLARAAVLEGLRRCAALGVKYAFVGSSQQFYYNIGFRPFANHTWWEQK